MSHTHFFSVVLSLSLVFMTSMSANAELPMTSGVPQSCGVQLKTHNFNTATIDQVNEVGFSTFRRGVYWDAVEKEKGVYNFDQYQKEFDHAKSKGMRILGCLYGSNKLYEDDGRGGIQTQAGREGFANFAAAVAKHFKDYDVIWEVWNEPNIRTFWRKDGTHNSEPFAQEYVDLVKTIMPAMLKADPDVFVMVGSVSNYWEPSYQWTEFCFDKGILDTGIKAWSVHPYGVRTPEEFSIGHDITRNLLKKYGHADMIMLNSERGFAVKKPKTQLELEGWSGGREVELRKYQAWHFVRQFMLDQLHDVRLTIWYEWDGDTFGMMTPDQSRPILRAAKVMIKQLNGYQLTRRITTENHRDYLLLWENDKGHRQLVAWTSPPAGGFPDEALVHDVTIDTNSAGSTFVTTDIDGKTSTSNQLKLSLSGSPQYVAIPAGVELGKITTAKPLPMANVDNQSLDLFTSDANWKFIKNTGEGSFSVAKDADGTPIGVMHFDFTNPGTKSTPYVISLVKVNIPSGDAITLNARTALAQKLTFRVSDSTGQTLQYKTSLQGGGDWETIRIPLDRKLEHWGGANDGKVHFPITSISMNIPRSQKEQLAGKVEYANAMIVGGRGSAVSTPQASSQTAGTTEGDLKLFTPSVTWQFLKNTGQGSFKVQSQDGVDMGVLDYDFTQSQSKSTPYVLAGASMVIGKGATGIIFKAKSDVSQKLTFRVTDSTGQTLQYKTKINGIGDWETIRIPLDRKLEHWGGANDGFVKFPTKQFYISVPRPSPEHLQGTVFFSQITAE